MGAWGPLKLVGLSGSFIDMFVNQSMQENLVHTVVTVLIAITCFLNASTRSSRPNPRMRDVTGHNSLTPGSGVIIFFCNVQPHGRSRATPHSIASFTIIGKQFLYLTFFIPECNALIEYLTCLTYAKNFQKIFWFMDTKLVILYNSLR